MADNMAPERGINKKIAAGILAGAVALGGVGYAATRGSDQPQPVNTETPSAAAASPTPKETPTPTVTATKSPEPSKSPEVTVDCRVLPKELCNQVEVVRFKNAQGQEFTLIVGNLPAGTPIYAPFDGQVSTGKINQPSAFQGFTVNMSDHGVSYNFKGDFRPLTTSAKTGATIATMTDTGAKSLNGTYNFVFDVERPNETKTDLVTAEDVEKQMFPEAFNKPIKNASYSGTTANTTLIVFEDNH